MNNDKSYTTGTVCGLTRLQLWSVQRYIKAFGEYFSERAKGPRGRRYTAKDIQNLLIIRQLYREHKDDEYIRAALRGEGDPVTLPHFDIQEAMQIVGDAIQINSASNQAVKKANNATQEAIYTFQRGEYMQKRFSQALEHFEEIPQLESNLRAMKAEFDRLSQEVAQLSVNLFLGSSNNASKAPLFSLEHLKLAAWVIFGLGIVVLTVFMIYSGVRAWIRLW